MESVGERSFHAVDKELKLQEARPKETFHTITDFTLSPVLGRNCKYPMQISLKVCSETFWISEIIVNGGRLVMKAGGLQRTNSLFWFMARHVTAQVHKISRWQAVSSFTFKFARVYSFLRMI